MTDLTFPMTMEVVGHDVEKVDVLDHFGNVITGRDGFRAGRNSGRQQKSWYLVGNGFTFEGQTQFFDQVEEGRPVVRTSDQSKKKNLI